MLNVKPAQLRIIDPTAAKGLGQRTVTVTRVYLSMAARVGDVVRTMANGARVGETHKVLAEHAKT